MLEAMRRNSRGTIVYVLFGIIIAVFVINFGPGQRGCASGLTNSFAARVAGSTVSEQEYRLYYVAVRGPSYPLAIAKQYRVKESVMDKIIERELLAQEAERLGFSVSEKEAEDFVVQGKMLILGVPRRFDDVVGGAFDYKRFRNFCEQLGVTVNKFIDVERREMLADKVKNLMLGAVKVTPDEVLASYVDRETKVNLEFVRFLPRQFESSLDELGTAEIAAYVKAHDKELRDAFKEREFLYKHLEKQVRLRRILVAVAKDEKNADLVQKAKAKADKAKKRITDTTKPEEFAKVAREMSDDVATRARGGDLGWHKKGYTGLDSELDGLAFEAKDGAVIGPQRTDQGFEILKVESFRQGDVSFEQVAGELAEDKLRGERAKAKAKAAADLAVANADGGTDLATLYPKLAEGDAADATHKGNAPPHIEESGLFPRHGELIPEIGVSAEMMKKAFALKKNEIAGPFDVTSSFVVVRLKERKDADKAEFEKKKEDEIRQMEKQKWADVLEAWSKQRCTEDNKAGRIKVNTEVLSYDGSTTSESAYTPCGGNKP